MTDRPDAKEMLEIARAALANEVLPFLPPDRRLTGLMVSSALAMAARELATTVPPLPAVTVVNIRGGGHDNDRALYDALLIEARARTAISNPRDLD